MCRQCWLCGRNGAADPLDKHHIFPGALRKKSEKYGLYIYLCHHSCHIFGKNSVHKNRDITRLVKQYGQRKAMKEQGWTTEKFIKEFGRNYLEEETDA